MGVSDTDRKVEREREGISEKWQQGHTETKEQLLPFPFYLSSPLFILLPLSVLFLLFTSFLLSFAPSRSNRVAHRTVCVGITVAWLRSVPPVAATGEAALGRHTRPMASSVSALTATVRYWPRDNRSAYPPSCARPLSLFFLFPSLFPRPNPSVHSHFLAASFRIFNPFSTAHPTLGNDLHLLFLSTFGFSFISLSLLSSLLTHLCFSFLPS